MHRSNNPSTTRVRIEARRADHPRTSATDDDQLGKEEHHTSKPLDLAGLLIEGLRNLRSQAGGGPKFMKPGTGRVGAHFKSS
jgi:hypothetical protein